jgi:hypothetical protein
MALVQGIPGVSIDPLYVEPDFPRVPLDLLEALEARFPDKCPDLRISPLDYGVIHGHLEVVRLLREMHERPPITAKEQS